MADKRYRAFISYSQKNKADGRRIQRWLEAYRLPKGVGIGGQRRLGRFFRDDEEMSASPDVGATLRGAIEDSESLIVVSSPHAARSRWVNAEIQHFRLTGRGDRIFAVIVDGIPNSGDPATECLPLALKAGDWDGLSMPVEPLALDLRIESKARVRARLAAGLLDLSFDDLWRREQRRRRWRVLQWSAACLAIVGTLGVLGMRLLDARRAARAQERADRLAGAIATLGANAPLALGTLRDLLKSDGADQAATDVARTILSWAKSPSEIPAAFPIPRLFNVNHRLVLHGKAAPLEIGDATPTRRIGFSRGRLIVFYGDRIVSLDSRSGTVLDTMEAGAGRDLPNVLFRGMAFEGADGTGIIAANHVGISNGQLWDVLLAVTSTGKLSLINLPMATKSWGAGFESASPVFISAACDALGLLGGPADQADSPKLLVRLQNGLQFGDVTTTMAGGLLTMLPPDLSGDGTGYWRADLEAVVKERGCRNAGFDSLGAYGFTGLGGLVLANDVVTSPAPPSEWRNVGPVAPVSGESSSQTWESRPLAADRSNPCAGGCRTLREDGGHADFDGEGAIVFSWVQTSLPPGGLSPGPVADQFAASPLYTFHTQHNAGIESVWCRRVQGTPLACVTAGVMLEYREDWSDIDLRSASGRFMFYSNGAGPFRMFDVQSMRHATPAGSQLGSKPGAAAFSAAPDDRLFVFSDNRLSAFEPDATSGKFVDISGSLSWQRRLAGTEAANAVIGVTSPAADELIAAAENGLLVRFEWRTGRSVWSRQITGIGKVRAIRRAPAGGYAAIIGERGIRVVRTRDGLLASGALLPPYLFDAGLDASSCIDSGQPVTELIRALTDVSITDTGTVTATCGAARFSWTAPPFSGDLVSRLDTLLAPPPPRRDR